MKKNKLNTIVSLKQEIRSKREAYTLILIFMIFSALIRIIPIIRGDTPFLFDHGRDMLQVKQIVIDHKLTLLGPFTGLQGVFQGPLHFYLLSIAFFVTNGNPLSGTYFLAMLGIFSVLLAYLLGRKIFGDRFGLLLGLMFAISPMSIAFSQHFWNPHWIPFCMILFYFFFYKSVFSHQKYLPWTFLMAGVIAQFEIAFAIFLPPLIILTMIVFRRGIFKYKWIYISFLMFFLTFICQALFDVRHHYLMTRAIINFFNGTNQSGTESIPFGTRFFYRLNEVQEATIYSLSNNRIVDYIFLIIGLLYTMYIVYKKQWKELKIIFFFLLAPILYFFGFLLYSHNAWTYYWIGLQVPYYFLISYILAKLFELFFLKKLVFIFISLWACMTIYGYSFWQKPDTGDVGTIRNELRVVNTIYSDADKQPFGVFVYTPPIYDYAYQYLFWWSAHTKYHYEPTKSKDGIFYLIIEPDPDHALYIKGWKETVIKSGKIEWDRVLPGGITIEKRKSK